MTGQRVQRVRTQVSEAQMAAAIISAWKQKFGVVPSKEQVAMVLAQNDLETGHRKSMWNYNVGNITTKAGGSFDYFDDLTTNEQMTPGVWKKMNLKYRAYSDLESGVKDYLNLLSSGRYTKSWEHIKNPDPISFSKALKAAGYYTGDEAPYTKNLVSLFAKNSKSNSYDLALSGKVKPLFTNKDKDMGGSNKSEKNTPLDSLLNKYLQIINTAEKKNKKLYKNFLPSNDILIQVSGSDYTTSVEFARILCSALEEELLAKAYTYTDGENIEVNCSIYGKPSICNKTVIQLASSIKESFQLATLNKIGNVEINTDIHINKKSSYKAISFKTASLQYRKFLLKFI